MIDLHIHTTASDGTDTPEELLQKIQEKGIQLFSITDHDNFQGSEAMLHLLEKDTSMYGKFICGVEFSCKDSEGKYHILGYGFDTQAEPVRQAVKEAHNNRLQKVKGRMEFLQEEFGFRFTEEDLEELFSNPNPGKPHIGNLIVKKGYAPDRNAAISDYVNKYSGKPSYLSPEAAIQAILASGGIPVLAHGIFGNGSQDIGWEDFRKRVDRLMSMGLKGLECWYSRYTEEQQKALLTLAEEKKLFATAGSDYHGSNKPVRLGQTNRKEGEPDPAPLKRFLEAVSKNGDSL